MIWSRILSCLIDRRHFCIACSQSAGDRVRLGALHPELFLCHQRVCIRGKGHMNKTVVYFLAFYFVCQFQGFCGDKLKLGTFSIPRMVENENQGTFISLTRDMAERVNLNIEIIIFPPKRAWVSFFKNKIDVIFPAFDVNFPEGTQKVTSIAVSSKPDYVFTRKGTPLFRTIEDLNGKRVGLTLGYPYEKKCWITL